MVEDYFAHASAARRYARSRPDVIHRLVAEDIRRVFEIEDRVASALDVACGTGQSTVLLASLADKVIGIDKSSSMVAEATPHDRVEYQVGRAESLPFEDDTFDLVTVALALHWLDRDRFLSEAARVLRPNGWFAIYTNWTTGRVEGVDAFETWFQEQYLARYRKTPRHSTAFPADVFREHGFDLVEERRYLAPVDMTVGEITDFLLTQSNVIARVEMGTEPLDDARHWIEAGVRSVVGSEPAALQFGGCARFLRLT